MRCGSPLRFQENSIIFNKKGIDDETDIEIADCPLVAFLYVRSLQEGDVQCQYGSEDYGTVVS